MTRSLRIVAVAAALVFTSVGCTGEVSPVGVDEPLVVRGATLRREALPGGSDAEGPAVTALESIGGVWSRGQRDRGLSGRVSEDAWAVGLEVVGLGSGFWLAPVGAPDPAFPGERAWNVVADVGGGMPAGVHTLRVVALDAEGRGGPWRELEVCVVDPRVPDGLNACDPTLPPPEAVLSLTWDADVDLDLVVVTPDGKTVDARHPTTAASSDGGSVPASDLRDPAVGRLDGDSLAGCAPDGRHAESLVFPELPRARGTYLVYVGFFAACGQPSVRFAVTEHRREALPEGGFRLQRRASSTGLLPSSAATGGLGPPLYVMAVELL